VKPADFGLYENAGVTTDYAKVNKIKSGSTLKAKKFRQPQS
jgi:hypothetical protein